MPTPTWWKSLPRSLNPRDRTEIEADLVAQGVDASVDDVVASFDLFERTIPFSMDPEPAHPALGPDWRYEPLPGEEGLFADDLRAFLHQHDTAIVREDIPVDHTACEAGLIRCHGSFQHARD